MRLSANGLWLIIFRLYGRLTAYYLQIVWAAYCLLSSDVMDGLWIIIFIFYGRLMANYLLMLWAASGLLSFDSTDGLLLMASALLSSDVMSGCRLPACCLTFTDGLWLICSFFGGRLLAKCLLMWRSAFVLWLMVFGFMDGCRLFCFLTVLAANVYG